MTEKVVLLHGIWRTSRSMALIARHLQREGYELLNLDYPSTTSTIEELVEHIHAPITEFAGAQGALHFIGHSMGGLVTRALLTRYPEFKRGKVVMLGTPNHGSEVADFVRYWRLFHWQFGPAGQQLRTDYETAGLFGPIDYPVGIVAGNFNLDPICGHIIGGPNDGKVSVESTKLAGMVAHQVVPVSHVMLTYNKRVNRLISQFLREGRFV